MLATRLRHLQVGGYIAGARQRLGCLAVVTVCASVRLIAAQTSLCSPHGSTALLHTARALTNIACTYHPTDAPAGR
jgi:hypothetical protein